MKKEQRKELIFIARWKKKGKKSKQRRFTKNFGQ